MEEILRVVTYNDGVLHESYCQQTRSSTNPQIKSQASPLTAGNRNRITGLYPCPPQSHSRAHPRFESPLPHWETTLRISRRYSNSYNTHPPPSTSRGPGLAPQPPILPWHLWVDTTEDKIEISFHQSWWNEHVLIPAAQLGYRGSLFDIEIQAALSVDGRIVTIHLGRLRVHIRLYSSSLDSEDTSTTDRTGTPPARQ